jgi:hypothetical protein
MFNDTKRSEEKIQKAISDAASTKELKRKRVEKDARAGWGWG